MLKAKGNGKIACEYVFENCWGGLRILVLLRSSELSVPLFESSVKVFETLVLPFDCLVGSQNSFHFVRQVPSRGKLFVCLQF